MRLLPLVLFFLAGLPASAEKPTVLVVSGAPGAERFGQLITKWSAQWKSAAEQADATFRQIGTEED